MGITSVPTFLLEEGLPFGRQSGASLALPTCTPFGNTLVIQTIAEAEFLGQITSLRNDMAKPQEHNNLLSSKKKGKKGAKATHAPSKQLVVPAPRDQPHLPKKVYSDCRHQINDREAERQRSQIRINAHLRDSRMTVLGNKSPIQKVRGLESMVESDPEYVPSKTQGSTYSSATLTRYSEAKPLSLRRRSEDYGSEEIPSRDPII
ncbi:unnamed protein product [Prunus armeniaca]